MRTHRYAHAAVLTALLGSIGCGSDGATSPTTTTTTSPITETWTGIIGAGGTASRSFTTSQPGTVTVTLTLSDAPLGIGIGVPRTANGGCRLTVSRLAEAGGTISAPADAGAYCVQLFDDGAVIKQAGFSVQIVYP
jgi:hypothetical protein